MQMRHLYYQSPLFSSRSKISLTQILVCSWSLHFCREEAVLVVQVSVWKHPFPWQGRSIFDRHFKVPSSCIDALKTVTVIHRFERALVFGAVGKTVNMLVILASRLKTDDPVSLNMKIFQYFLLRKTFAILVKATPSSSSNFTTSSLKSMNLY